MKLAKILAFMVISTFFITLSCSQRGSAIVPKDLLGLTIGMAKADAQQRLGEIGKFERDERKRQEVWSLTNDPRFQHVAVGYDAEGRVRYITAFAKKDATERIKFTDVADISRARPEVGDSHYRYVWDIPPVGSSRGYQLILYGDQKDYVSLFTLVEHDGIAAKEEEEEDD